MPNPSSSNTLKLAGAFLLLVVVSVFLLVKGKPTAKNVNPLKKVETADIGKIFIQKKDEKILVERNEDDKWQLLEPLKDWGDFLMIDRVSGYLITFSIDSIISTNPEKYEKFDITDEKAARIKVYLKGKEEPLLNGYVGKNVVGRWNSVYFRFEGRDDVFITNNFNRVALDTKTLNYRYRRLVDPGFLESDRIKAVAGKTTVEITRSSNTWTNVSNGVGVSFDWVKALGAKLEGWNITEFGTGKEEAPALGINEPVLTLVIERGSYSSHVTVGKEVPNYPDKHYAQVKGRPATLIVSKTSVNEIVSYLKTL